MDSHSSNEVRVYPNPNGGQFFIEGMDKGIAYTIFDFHGREIYDGVIQSQVEEVNVLNASEGLYYLEAKQNGNLSRIRFVITK